MFMFSVVNPFTNMYEILLNAYQKAQANCIMKLEISKQDCRASNWQCPHDCSCKYMRTSRHRRHGQNLPYLICLVYV